MPSNEKFEQQNFILKDGESYEDCDFHSIDFSEFSLKNCLFVDCTFLQCNLANIEPTSGSIRNCVFKNSNLIGINWCVLKNFSRPRFESCKLNYSVFQNLRRDNRVFIECSLVEVDFTGCDLSKSDFSHSNFAGANLNGANLTGSDFRSSKDYVFDIRTTKIKGSKFSFPYVASLITALGAEVDM